MKMHSQVAIITNSSTELFVIDPNKFSLHEVEEKLDRIYELLGRPSVGSITIADTDVTELSSYPTAWHKYYQKYNKGDILLEAEDSEFGYEALAMIEVVFKAERYHLG